MRELRFGSLLVTGCVVLLLATAPADAQCSADPWADTVVDSSMSTADPLSVLGAPDGVLADFEEVGTDPGFVTVEFDDPIVDGPGDDFLIHVVDFPSVETIEAFEVFVSPDGIVFTSLGIVFPTVQMQNVAEALGFDLNGSGLAEVRQVMIVGLDVDLTNPNEGVDIDAFEALNCTPMDLTVCLDDLGACEGTLASCEGDLQVCTDGFDTCVIDRDQALADLGQCEIDRDQALADLMAASASIDEGLLGLAEIRRLIALPPGQRHSAFTCSGDLCAGIQAAIDMLEAPPGQNVREGRGRGGSNRR